MALILDFVDDEDILLAGAMDRAMDYEMDISFK